MSENVAQPVPELALREFVDSGLLQEVNRQFFHPLGLALYVRNGGSGPALGGIWDGRDDPEGFIFEAFTPEEIERGRVIQAEQERRASARYGVLGFGVQPLQAAATPSQEGP